MVLKKEKIMGGFIIEKTLAGVILSIRDFIGQTVKVNDEVVSNGRSLSKGVKARVIQINTPYQGAHSSDVICCLVNSTESDSSVDSTICFLKFEDLELNLDAG
jgi:hypothetical protein